MSSAQVERSALRVRHELIPLLVAGVMPQRHTCDIRFLHKREASLKPAEIRGSKVPISVGFSV
jgi:hypothetical protein